MDDEYEERIAVLLEKWSSVRRRLEKERGLAKDAAGQTIILGLDTSETEEFLKLYVHAWEHENGRFQRREDNRAAVYRYYELHNKYDLARAGIAPEQVKKE